jgi:DnaJ-class molecular chaperone
MINRILITGKNSSIPRLRDLYVCSDCGGDGWVHGWSNNPSEPPFRADCRNCNGEGVIEKRRAA